MNLNPCLPLSETLVYTYRRTRCSIVTKKMGLVIPEKTQFFSRWAYNYYFTEILRGSIAAANLFEWNIMIHHSGMEEIDDYFRFCEDEHIDGVVCLAPVFTEEDLEVIKEVHTSIIVINGRYPGISYVGGFQHYNTPYIWLGTDDTKIVREGTVIDFAATLLKH